MSKVDKVRPLKIENPIDGTEDDQGYQTQVNPEEDYIAVKGIAFENNDDIRIYSDSNIMRFQDNESDTVYTLQDLVSSSGYREKTGYVITGGVRNISKTKTILASYGLQTGIAGPVVIENGEIVGLSLSLSTYCKGGSCIGQIGINGVYITNTGYYAVIDDNNPIYAFVEFEQPVPFVSGSVITLRTVTSNFKPKSADATIVCFMRSTI